MTPIYRFQKPVYRGYFYAYIIVCRNSVEKLIDIKHFLSWINHKYLSAIYHIYAYKNIL